LPRKARRRAGGLCAVGEGAAAGLDDAAARPSRRGVPVRPERVEGEDDVAGEVLLARSAVHGVDLLVIGTYGSSSSATPPATRRAPPVPFAG
jgi:nucleotide-binding universal stress UspA family protein